MQQFGRSGARGAALRGNGWREGGKFSIAAMIQSSPKKRREAMIKAAIRRMKFAKEGDETPR